LLIILRTLIFKKKKEIEQVILVRQNIDFPAL